MNKYFTYFQPQVLTDELALSICFSSLPLPLLRWEQRTVITRENWWLIVDGDGIDQCPWPRSAMLTYVSFPNPLQLFKECWHRFINVHLTLNIQHNFTKVEYYEDSFYSPSGTRVHQIPAICPISISTNVQNQILILQPEILKSEGIKLYQLKRTKDPMLPSPMTRSLTYFLLHSTCPPL